MNPSEEKLAGHDPVGIEETLLSEIEGNNATPDRLRTAPGAVTTSSKAFSARRNSGLTALAKATSAQVYCPALPSLASSSFSPMRLSQ